MKNYLEKLPKEIQDLINIAGNIAGDLGFKAYLVGGLVRDLILSVDNYDLDIVIEGEGIEFAKIFARKLEGKIVCHPRFMTATIVLPNDLKIDVVTARKEIYPNPAVLPVVSPGSLDDDLFRRDFTINALAIQITGKDFGKLIDVYDGRKDLEAKILRILHSKSFIDDPTRIIRGIRFEQRFGFSFERNTKKCLKEAVRNKIFKKLQPQRLRDEIQLILQEKDPKRNIFRLNELLGTSFLGKSLKFNKQTKDLVVSLAEQIAWFKNIHKRHRHLDIWLIYLISFLDSFDLSKAKDFCDKFVLHKADSKKILQYFSRRREVEKVLVNKRIEPSDLFHLLSAIEYEVIILIRARNKNQNLQKNINDFFAFHHEVKIMISGKDLCCLGLKPGAQYQKIFKQVLNAKLNGKISTKEEEINFVKEII